MLVIGEGEMEAPPTRTNRLRVFHRLYPKTVTLSADKPPVYSEEIVQDRVGTLQQMLVNARGDAYWEDLEHVWEDNEEYKVRLAQEKLKP